MTRQKVEIEAEKDSPMCDTFPRTIRKDVIECTSGKFIREAMNEINRAPLGTRPASCSPCIHLSDDGRRCPLQQDYKPRCPCVDYKENNNGSMA